MEIARDSVANHKRDDIGVTGNTADEKKSSNTFVVSDVTDGIVTLVSNCLHVLDFPLSLLPFDVEKGQILQLDIRRAVDAEIARERDFQDLQNDLINASARR